MLNKQSQITGRGLLLKLVSWMVANSVLYKTNVLQSHGRGFGHILWNDLNSVNGHDVLTLECLHRSGSKRVSKIVVGYHIKQEVLHMLG